MRPAAGAAMKAARRSGVVGRNSDWSLERSRLRLAGPRMRPRRAPCCEFRQTCCFLFILLEFLWTGCLGPDSVCLRGE